MSYKLTPEEIKKRIKEIYWPIPHQDTESRILKLIEDATGEKIPEPFDESKVRHGSVWEDPTIGDRVTLLRGWDGEHLQGLVIRCPWRDTGTRWTIGSFSENTIESHAEYLKRNKWKYLGQYDFAAGLPK